MATKSRKRNETGLPPPAPIRFVPFVLSWLNVGSRAGRRLSRRPGCKLKQEEAGEGETAKSAKSAKVCVAQSEIYNLQSEVAFGSLRHFALCYLHFAL